MVCTGNHYRSGLLEYHVRHLLVGAEVKDEAWLPMPSSGMELYPKWQRFSLKRDALLRLGKFPFGYVEDMRDKRMGHRSVWVEEWMRDEKIEIKKYC